MKRNALFNAKAINQTNSNPNFDIRLFDVFGNLKRFATKN